jgi:hypothetical protein
MKYRQEAISWLLHSVKILLGDESIRRYIIVKYNPDIDNQAKKCIRTFNAFVQNGKSRDDKAKQIVKFCDEMSKREGIVVFTATNIQKDKLDMETHFQSYILNNNLKTILTIDPAFDRTKDAQAGIYMAEVSNEVVIPFFLTQGYSSCFVDLSNPAQVCDGDVFCQSWSLLILLNKIRNSEFLDDISFDIPHIQIDKYDMLLQFYQQIFTDLPELGDNLKTEYEAEVTNTRGPNAPTKVKKQCILDFDPRELLLSMTKNDMI